MYLIFCHFFIRVEINALEIGLQLNSKKSNIMAFSQTNPVNICTTLK